MKQYGRAPEPYLVPHPARLKAWAPERWHRAAGWHALVADFFCSAPGRQLGEFVTARLAAGAIIYPPEPLRALSLTPPERVRVVILGQDPYHGPGQAEGLAFSVPPGMRVPPSLRNIQKEMQRDLGTPPAPNGSLAPWAERGVLLLNTCLTVESGQPASHAGRGWERLTDAVLRHVADQVLPTVFLLWGGHAQARRALVDRPRHLVLAANHPSPLSAARPPMPFLGCGHFSAARDWLAARGEPFPVLQP